MTDAARLRFLPWLRIGAVGLIANDDPLEGPLSSNAALEPWLRIAGHHAIRQPATLRGPGHVTALGPQTVVKTQPRDGVQDFEPNYFPFVELRAADLPWRFTPAAPGTNNQLRPWLVLIVVRQQKGVGLTPEPGVPLPILSIGPPAKPSVELPDLVDSAAWVHVQANIEPDKLIAEVGKDPTVALARLVCPRRLEKNTAWIACLVPAFDVGIQAGFGGDGAVADQARPAWDLADGALDQDTVRLPVYFSWTFSTGPDGDFEGLARRLEPDEGGAVLGRVDLDVTDPGAPLPPSPATKPVVADFVGALKSPAVTRGGLPETYAKWLSDALEPVIETGAQRPSVPPDAPQNYRPAHDDPIVAPPLYGSFQAGRYDIPDAAGDRRQAWMRPLNLQPDLRAVAGLGAAVVRANQGALMASAWAQAGSIRETRRALDGGQLAAEIGRSMARRVQSWDPGAVLQATQPVHPWIASPASSKPLAVDLRHGALPPGLVGAPFARATRPRTALGRRWGEKFSAGSAAESALAVTTEKFLAATSPAADAATRAVLDFARTSLPVGAWTHDPALEAEPTTNVEDSAVPKRATPGRAAVARPPAALAHPDLTGPISGKSFDGTITGVIQLLTEVNSVLRRGRRAPIPARPPLLDLSAAVGAIDAGLDPLPHIQAALIARIPALTGRLTPDGALPRKIMLQPLFADPLSWDLIRLNLNLLLPGIDALSNNRVTLLAIDDAFVAAFLVGANHEMSRELLWREFPTSRRNTFFHRFWDTGEEGPDDIGDIAGWRSPSLGGNLTGTASSDFSVVLLRADLLRRYPDAHIYLTRGTWQDDTVVPDPTRLEEPVLQGALDARTSFCGFAVSSDDLRGRRGGSARAQQCAGWFVTIEEPSAGPRMGLNMAAEDGSDLVTGAAGWQALSWGHLVATGGALADISHAVARKPLPPRTAATQDGLAWGHNAAHMAAITWRRPFRLYIHADRLLSDISSAAAS
jgi:hypothetical protein